MNSQFAEPRTENGTEFTPHTFHLALHVLLAIVACLLAGYVATAVSRRSGRSYIVLDCLLLCVGVAKAAITWQLVPIWYHIAFTGVLIPATIAGGALRGQVAPSPPPSSVPAPPAT